MDRTTQDGTGSARREGRRKPRWLVRFLAGAAALVILALVLAGALLVTLVRGPVPLPSSLADRIEAALSVEIAPYRITFADLSLALDPRTRRPNLEARGVRVEAADGRPIAFVGKTVVQVDPAALVAGRIRFSAVSLTRGVARVRRDEEGRFEVTLGLGKVPHEEIAGEGKADGNSASDNRTAGDAAEIEAAAFDLVAMFDNFITRPVFAPAFRLDLREITLLIDDRTTGRRWRLEKGLASLERKEGRLTAELRASLAEGRFGPAHGRFTLSHEIGSDALELAVRLDNIATRDIADQLPPLDWLRVVDAPSLGALTLGFDRRRGLTRLEAALEIGRLEAAGGAADAPVPEGTGVSGGREGASPADPQDPTAAADAGPDKAGETLSRRLRPLLTRGKIYLAYDPAEARFRFDEIRLAGPLGSIDLEGHAYPTERVDGRPGGLIAQLTVKQGRLAGPPFLAEPQEIRGGTLDLRLRTRPAAELDIGQFVLDTRSERFVVSGRMVRQPDGLHGEIGVMLDAIAHDRLLALWPLDLVPRTRTWFARNVHGGLLRNVVAGLSLRGPLPPRTAASFDLEDVRLRFIRTFPLLEKARGFGELADQKLTLAMLAGEVPVPDKGVIDVADTVFTIPDITEKPASAEVALTARGPLPALLDLLDHPPFRFLAKGGVPGDIAEGRFVAGGRIGFPLLEFIPTGEISLDLSGRIADFRSTRLMAGHVVTAPQLAARVDGGGVIISGEGLIDGKVAIGGSWRQRFGKAHVGRSRFEGRVALSPAFLDVFGIALPEGTVAGRSWADLAIDLARGQAPHYLLESGLRGLSLAIPPLGWRKGVGTDGRFLAEGRFGKAPSVDRLVLEAPGLRARGHVTLAEGGGFRVAEFDSFARGDWLSGRLRIGAADRDGVVPISLEKGRLDLRRASFGGGGGKGGARIRFGLERVTVSAGIAITGVDGVITTRGGLSGRFTGRVAGKAPIAGTLAPDPRRSGTAARITASDAGAVLAAAGVFANGRGGRLDLVLRPGERPGVYDGHLGIRGIRVVKAPALAELLSAISVVGALEQLSGEGLLFNEVEGRFRIEPDKVVVRQGSAVSASLGITLEGIYRLAERTLDMRGVVTPVYILNGLFEQTRLFGGLLGRKKGEGVFGFTYRLQGSVDAPKVSVNPLSALAPGFLRDIFRSPLPSR